jgi:KDO2-lipid IV(A) lauroyltransferase
MATNPIAEAPRRGGWLGVRDALEYLLIRSIITPTTWMPRRTALRVGAALGDFVYHAVRIRRRVVEQNLAATLGQTTEPRELRRIARDVYRQLGRTLIEWARNDRLTAGEMAELVTFYDVEHAEQALALGRGALLVTAHFGNWELMGAAWCARGHTLSFVAKPQRNPLVDRYLNRSRQRVAAGLVLTGGLGLREILRRLRQGESIGILSDQDAGPSGVFLDFLGRTASVQPGAALFAIRTGAPIVQAYDVRDEHGRHHVHFQPPLFPDTQAEESQEIERLLREVVSGLERMVRRHPDHWYWVHRRWKTRPPSELRDETGR